MRVLSNLTLFSLGLGADVMCVAFQLTSMSTASANAWNAVWALGMSAAADLLALTLLGGKTGWRIVGILLMLPTAPTALNVARLAHLLVR